MRTVLEKQSILRVLRRTPDDVLVCYEAWKRIVERSGPKALKLVKGFHDESLKGSWIGFRSSRLGIKWRVICKIVDEELEVFAIELTPHGCGT